MRPIPAARVPRPEDEASDGVALAPPLAIHFADHREEEKS
jgi:hypothetical protein